MKPTPLIAPFFYMAALYDGLLGLLFLLKPLYIFEAYMVTPPNHVGYVQFPAALLIIFALMFFAIARDPLGNRNLIPYGILLKVAFCGVTFYHWAATGIPVIWKPFAFADLIFLVLFIVCYWVLKRSPEALTDFRE